MANAIRHHLLTLQKTASDRLVHIPANVACAVTGELVAALTLSLQEPTVLAFALFTHERLWKQARPRGAVASARPSLVGVA